MSGHTPVQNGTSTVQAVGREACLGCLYNAIDETFSPVTVFNNALPSTLIQSTKIPWTNSQYVVSNSLKEKSSILDLTVELQASVMFDLVKINGSAKYLHDETTSSQSISAVMDYKIRTDRESINLFYDDMLPHLNKTALTSVRATHILTAIDYGANVVASFTETVSQTKSTDDVKGNLQVVIKALLGLVGGKGDGKLTGEQKTLDKNNQISIKIFGDVSPTSGQPQNFDQVIDFMKNVPSLVKDYNEGKGKPITYTLIPVSTLMDQLDLGDDPKPMTPLVCHTVDPGQLQELLQLNEDAANTAAELRSLMTTFKTYEKCLRSEVIEEVEELEREFKSYFTRFKSETKEAVISVRGGFKTNSDLENIRLNYQKTKMSPKNVKTLLRSNESFQSALEKIDTSSIFFISTGGRNSIEYLSGPRLASQLDTLLGQSRDRPVFVLFFRVEWIQEGGEKEREKWREIRRRFLNLLSDPLNKLVVVDLGVCGGENEKEGAPDSKTLPTSIALHLYRNGRLISQSAHETLLKKEDQDLPQPTLITLPALGHPRPIGCLYNEKTGQFLEGSSILKSEHRDLIESRPTLKMENSVLLQPPTHLYHRNSTEDEAAESFVWKPSILDKLKALKIPPEIGVKLLCGIIPLEKCLKFLQPETFNPDFDDLEADDEDFSSTYSTNSESITGALVNSWTTYSESIPIDQISGALSQFALTQDQFNDDERPTHFLQKITYGAQTAVEMTGQSWSDVHKDLKTVRDLLQRSLAPPPDSEDTKDKNPNQSDSATTAPKTSFKLVSKNLVIKVYSDVANEESDEGPIIIREDEELLFDVLQEIPGQVRGRNEGKGEPIFYHLYPITKDNKSDKTRVSEKTSSPESLTPRNYTQIIELFEKIEGARYNIKNTQRLLSSRYSLLVLDSTVQIGADFERAFQNKVTSWISKVRDSILLDQTCRLEKENESTKIFDDIKIEFDQLGLGKRGMTETSLWTKLLEQVPWICEKISLFNMTASQNIGYLGKGSSINQVFMAPGNDYNNSPLRKSIYFLRFSKESKEKNPELWLENLYVFFNLHTLQQFGDGGSNSLIERFLVDLDFEVGGFTKDKEGTPRISQYVKGVRMDKDVAATLRKKRSLTSTIHMPKSLRRREEMEELEEVKRSLELLKEQFGSFQQLMGQKFNAALEREQKSLSRSSTIRRTVPL